MHITLNVSLYHVKLSNSYSYRGYTREPLLSTKKKLNYGSRYNS